MPKKNEIPGETTLAQWHAALERMRARGTAICPIMVREEGKHRPELCACDIPQIRAQFVQEHGDCCANETDCLPRTSIPASRRQG